MILCNIVHYFSNPYLMMKNSLSKMNAGWETTAMLMGDSWPKTILRVVTPNAASSLIEVFSYYFINAMVTISALIFLAGARTMVLTTKINSCSMSMNTMSLCPLPADPLYQPACKGHFHLACK